LRALALLRLQVAERQVLELPFELPDAEPARQRREYRARFDGQTLPLGQPGGIGRQVSGMA
jgi:hypothetical protein